VPELALQLEVTTPLRSQELTGKFGPSYWEGAIDATGTHAGEEISGSGYMEMTGYAEGPPLPGNMAKHASNDPQR
jgi:predicted secreted hydrolase